MNGKGGCCVAKYGGGGGEGMYGGMSKVDRIMLKFRPIAPKPVAIGSGLGCSGADSGDGYVKCATSKRKYVRVKKINKNNNNSKRRKVKELPAVTLPLLPETPDRKENEPVTGFSNLLSLVKTTKCKNDSSNNNKKRLPMFLSFESQDQQVKVHTTVTKASSTSTPAVVSYVTVECVTDTWVEWEGLGCTDEEIMMNMKKDTCPGFVSDGQDRVVWINKAYRHMAGVEDISICDHLAVVLVRKDKWVRSVVKEPAFTCKVRVSTFAAHNRRQSLSPTLTVPCDVWRMKRGTCAWRLDVKAALSLGR